MLEREPGKAVLTAAVYVNREKVCSATINVWPEGYAPLPDICSPCVIHAFGLGRDPLELLRLR